MARTDAENCEILCQIYDKMLDGLLVIGSGAVEIEIRGRVVKFTTAKQLSEAMAEIRQERDTVCAKVQAASGTGTPARNLVRLKRGTSSTRQNGYC